MGQRTIALVYGRVDSDSPPDEQDVLVQLDAVRSALQALGYDTTDVPLSLDLGVSAAVLRSVQPLAAFNLAETIEGKGNLIHLAPSLLESLGIPYTGAPAEAIILTSHKLVGKRLLAAAGIDTPPFAAGEAADGLAAFELPGIVKSVWEHASVGLEDSSIVRTPAELAAEISRRSRRESPAHLFVERYIDGREFNLALLGGAGSAEPQVLPPAEIRFVDYPRGKPRIVGYRAKWDEESFEYRSTPRRFDFPRADALLLDGMCGIARACWKLFGLRGYARVDFRVDEDGRPWVLEVNANPCISPDAGFMAAAGQAGLSREEVVRRILADARVPKEEPIAWAAS
ncbi:MAG TPA: D-alanine--D-alanine ligase [Spirochaetia bacterium]|nr:D-alanine--D-alanine ligase [Spirochaetia bacterium]